MYAWKLVAWEGHGAVMYAWKLVAWEGDGAVMYAWKLVAWEDHGAVMYSSNGERDGIVVVQCLKLLQK